MHLMTGGSGSSSVNRLARCSTVPSPGLRAGRGWGNVLEGEHGRQDVCSPCHGCQLNSRNAAAPTQPTAFLAAPSQQPSSGSRLQSRRAPRAAPRTPQGDAQVYGAGVRCGLERLKVWALCRCHRPLHQHLQPVLLQPVEVGRVGRRAGTRAAVSAASTRQRRRKQGGRGAMQSRCERAITPGLHRPIQMTSACASTHTHTPAHTRAHMFTHAHTQTQHPAAPGADFPQLVRGIRVARLLHNQHRPAGAVGTVG